MNVYVGAHKENNIIKNSSSGGAFTVLTDYFIKQMHGVVYGCVLDEHLRAYHIRTDSCVLRDKMRGSKYIQSNIGDSYIQVKKDLTEGVKVLFSGTPCQIQALYSFLILTHTNTDNLFTVAVLCHGVASGKFFADYIKYLESSYSSKAISCNFRSKRRKGQKQGMEVRFKNGKTYYSATTKYDWFYSIYHKDYLHRPSCYACKYTNGDFNCDIILADSWKKDYVPGEANSLILTKSEKGDRLFNNSTKDNFSFTKCDETVIRYPTRRIRDDIPIFWDIYLTQGYLAVQKYIGNNTLKGRLKAKMASVVIALRLTKILKR